MDALEFKPEDNCDQSHCRRRTCQRPAAAQNAYGLQLSIRIVPPDWDMTAAPLIIR